jgi:hypothetical protein
VKKNGTLPGVNTMVGPFPFLLSSLLHAFSVDSYRNLSRFQSFSLKQNLLFLVARLNVADGDNHIYM